MSSNKSAVCGKKIRWTFVWPNLHYEKFANGTVKCIEDEIPFDLPEGWSWERLSNLASFSGGKTPSTSKREYWEGNILWVTSKDMKCKYIDSSLLMISEKGLEQMQLYPENTLLLVTRSGILRHTIPVAILKKSATINQDLKAIMLYIPNLEEYIYICIKGMESRLILEYTKAGATVENINFDSFQKILLPIPPENQIQRIIDATNDTDEVIGKLKIDQEDLIDIIDKTKSKILDLAIRGKLVPQNPEDEPASVLLERIRAEKDELIRQGKIKRDKKESVIFKGEDNSYYVSADGIKQKIEDYMQYSLPKGWVWICLKDVATISSGKTPISELLSENGLIPYYKISDMNVEGNELFLDKTTNYLNDKYDGVVFSKGSFVFPKNGGAVLTNKKRILLHDSLVDLNTGVITFSPFIDAEYAFLMFLFIDFSKLYKGSTIPTVDANVISSLIFALPPLNEQQHIVQVVKKVFTQLDTIAESLS